MDVKQVEGALDRIVDPCSISVGVPLSIREMGLIDDVAIDDHGDVRIELRLTSVGCLVGVFNFEPEIESLVSKLPGVRNVTVVFNDPLEWTEDKIEPAARERLRAHRVEAASKRQLPIVAVHDRNHVER